MTLTTAPTMIAPDRWPTQRMLSTDSSQQIFRHCLTSLSRPGLISALPAGVLPDDVPQVIAPLLALADLMAPITGLDSSSAPGATDAARLIGMVTGAKISEPGRARFALAFGEPDDLTELSIGSNWSPEYGALLCQRVSTLGNRDHDQDRLQLRLAGPGIKNITDISVGGLSESFFATRAAMVADFPTGIDLLLITDDGRITGLPRTTRIEVR